MSTHWQSYHHSFSGHGNSDRHVKPHDRSDRHLTGSRNGSVRPYQSTTKAIPSRNVRPRSTWPPTPYVEDEAISLRREAGARRPTRHDDVLYRGTIDQDPLLDEVNPAKPVKQQPIARPCHRKDKRHVTTPPTSDDDGRAAAAPRYGPHRLDTTTLPEMSRTPSPYHYPAASFDVKRGAPQPTEQSPRYMTPPPSSTWQKERAFDSAFGRPLGPQRDSQNTKQSSTNSNNHGQRGEDEARSMHEQARFSTDSFTGTTFVEEPKPMYTDRHIDRGGVQSNLSSEVRRHTDSYPVTHRQHVVESIKRPAPIQVTSLVREESDQYPNSASRKSSHERLSSRSSSRASSENFAVWPPSPPRSPRISLERPPSGYQSADRSAQHQAEERPTSHSLSFTPQPAHKVPQNPEQYQNISHAHQERPAPVHPTTNLHNQWTGELNMRKADTLPYPTTDFFATMPEERDHQFVHENVRPLHVPSLPARPSGSRGPSFEDSRQTAKYMPTPPSLSRHTSGGSFVPTTPLPLRPASSNLPPCPRSQYTQGFTDWYTIEGLKDFDICPHCFDSVFDRTLYAHHFRPVTKSRSATVAVRCDFAKPWYRLAWLLTVQRQTAHLNLLKDLHNHLLAARACPDEREESREWYTILDDQTRKPIRDLHICAADIRSVEILLPGLRGFWVPFPRRASTTIDTTPRQCSFRTSQNNRFPIFIDSLITSHETAQRASPPRIPDMVPFVQLVKHKLDMEECPRDNIMQGQKWFFIPSLPEFTVCEDCHDDIVVPHLRRNAELALRFGRSLQHLPSSDGGSRSSMDATADFTRAASCSLYSSRMRRYFARAVEDNDLKYLSKKAKERKRKEIELQRKAQPVISKMVEAKGLLESYEQRPGHDRMISRLEEDLEKYEDDLTKYREEWADYE